MNCKFIHKLQVIFQDIILVFLFLIILVQEIYGAEQFFPIGMFSVGLDGLETVKETGFNTAHTCELVAIMDT